MTRLAVGLTSTLVAAATAGLALRPAPVHACGGCFSPPETVTTVDSHRMAIALAVERTVLWDQIRYSGDPRDFVWVLPVPTPDAALAVADSGFFDELEAQTAPRVLPPPLPPPPDCPPPPGDFGGSPAQDAGAAASPDAGVDVFREETVGPYETVVVGSEDPQALVNWLTTNGYNVPESTVPVMQHYVEMNSVFIVLRLAPDQGVAAMQPVRVSYPGYMATFPLEMVKVGASGSLDLTLWVIAEQRYAAHNYGTVTIDAAELAWDFWAGRSNYGELFRTAIDDAGGAAWVAEFARPFDQLWFDAWEEAAYARNDIPNAFLTRLRTDALVDHLDRDLVLAPSEDAGQIGNALQAHIAVNAPPPRQCPDWDGDGEPDTWADRTGSGHGVYFFGCTCDAARDVPAGPLGALSLVLGVALVLRRRR